MFAQNSTHYLPIQLVANLESFIALFAELTKQLLRCFYHGDLAVLTLSEKNCLITNSIQDCANTVKCEQFFLVTAKPLRTLSTCF